MKDEKVNLQKCLPSKERILRMAAYNRIVRSFRSSHFTEELQAHKMWRITNLVEHYDPADAPRVPEYKGQFPMFVLPDACRSKTVTDTAPCESQDSRPDANGVDEQLDQEMQGPKTLAEKAGTREQPAESSRSSHKQSNLDCNGQSQQSTRQDVLDDSEAAEAAESGELEGICVVCIEKSALFVMHECGHLIFCPGCRRKAVAKELKESGKTQWKSVKPGQLSNKELERTKVRCPICREESVAVAQKKFSGKVYT